MMIKTLMLAGMVTLAGCAGLDDHQQRVGSGAIIGGVAGGLIGGNATGAIIGGVAGGLIGNEVDHSARRQQEEQERAYQRQRERDECLRYHSYRYCDRY